MARSGQPQSGHICPHECDTNNTLSILRANNEVLDEHSLSVQQTEQNDLDKQRNKSKTIRIAASISTSSGRRSIKSIMLLVCEHLQKKNYVMTT